MKKKDVGDLDLGINPLLNNLVIPIRRISKKNFDENGIPKFGIYDLDMTDSVKFYISPEFRDLLSQLKGSSAQLLLWIMQKVENGNDYVWLKRKTCMAELGISSVNTFKYAVKSLCSVSAIAPIYMKPDIYFINPKVFFHGSRAKRFPDNVKVYRGANADEFEEKTKEEVI